jgi:3-hydroxybutyryl-CoA dehydrogenase
MFSYNEVMVIGDERSAYSIAVSLLKAGDTVYFVTKDEAKAKEHIRTYLRDTEKYTGISFDIKKLRFLQHCKEARHVGLAIVITEEDEVVKKNVVEQLETELSSDALIAINSESILLHELQKDGKHVNRIIGLNWALPAHTTNFLEIITNEWTCLKRLSALQEKARTCWEKDPYTVQCGYSVRARLMAAITREAFFLVDNGYASIEDVDRACRNDAGYYLPFAGNCRYMDLMGTHAYGLVMKDLYKELSQQDKVSDKLADLLADGKLGMEHGNGFYKYTKKAASQWEEKFRQFSFQIKEIIDKYPFNYLDNELTENPLLKIKVIE